jgi:hypothetical protein
VRAWVHHVVRSRCGHGMAPATASDPRMNPSLHCTAQARTGRVCTSTIMLSRRSLRPSSAPSQHPASRHPCMHAAQAALPASTRPPKGGRRQLPSYRVRSSAAQQAPQPVTEKHPTAAPGDEPRQRPGRRNTSRAPRTPPVIPPSEPATVLASERWP